MLYFVQVVKSKFIKIGYTEKGNEFKRIVDLRIDSSEEVRLLNIIGGSERDEGRLHRKFEHLRKDVGWLPSPTEWFYPGDDLLDFIEKTKGVTEFARFYRKGQKCDKKEN